MREFELTFDKLGKGLRPRSKQVRNSEHLTECFNFRVSGTGLEPYSRITQLFSGVALTPSWPFPQLISTARYKFLIVRDVLAGEDIVYEVAADWSLTHIVTADYFTFGIGDRWSVADFDEYVLLTSGALMIYRDTTLDAFIPILALATIPRCKSFCNFKGQLIGGHVESAWHSQGESDIIWSQIGNIDCTLTRNNEAGFKRIPFEGEVYQVKRLGHGIVAYCEKGIIGLVPVREPAPTFGFVEILESGLYSKYAVGGNEFQQMFVDEEGFLYRIDPEFKLTKLEYDEFTTTLGDIVITHNEKKNDFYIGDGTNGYLLTEFGLSEISESPNSLYWNDELTGISVVQNDDEARLTTDAFDMGLAGQKTSHVIEVIGDGSGVISSALDYRYNRSNSFERTSFVQINDQNVASLRVAGVEYRITVKCDDYEDFNLDYIKLRYNMSDLRNIRGVYAPPPRGQS